MRSPSLSLLVILALGAGACGPDTGEEFETPDAEDTSVLPSPAMQAEFAELRSEVDSVVGSLRQQVDSLQQQAVGDTLEAWTEAASNIQQREGELLMGLDRLNTADLEDARDIRSDIASQLAGLEGDLVRRQVEYTVASNFTAVAVALENRLSQLEGNLDTMAVHVDLQDSVDDMEITRPGGEATDASVNSPPPPGDTMDRATAGDLGDPTTTQVEDVPDAEQIRELREEVQEVRGELEELRAAEDTEEWNDAKQDIAEQVAELTRQVRQHWYNVRYSFHDMTLAPAGGTGMPRGEE